MIPNKFPVCYLCFKPVKKQDNIHVQCGLRKHINDGLDDGATSYQDTHDDEDYTKNEHSGGVRLF